MTMKNKKYLLPFILVTTCFALWGFANNIMHPLVQSFSKIFRMSVTDGAMIQVAFYAGYFAMALPAALFIRKYSYKAGILMGLALYALGSFLFVPAREIGSYYPFLIAYFVLTCGLSFLETSANPFIISMGDPKTATRRLNLAQAFNPVGNLLGMYVAMEFIQSRLNPLSSAERFALGDAEFEAVKQSDLAVLVGPYVVLGVFILALLVVMAVVKMPGASEAGSASAAGSGPETVSASAMGYSSGLATTFRRLFTNVRYREGVLAEFCYVGAQVMCWTYIIQYGMRVFMDEGMSEQAAEILSQKYNMAAMILFCAGRFICTWLLRFIREEKLLAVLSVAACAFLVGVIFSDGRMGLYCLVAVSACMSLMFPTIYGMALEEVGDDAKIGAAGLIMAILGGSVIPPVQAAIIDGGFIGLSFLLPLLCFAVVAWYGWRCAK